MSYGFTNSYPKMEVRTQGNGNYAIPQKEACVPDVGGNAAAGIYFIGGVISGRLCKFVI